MHVLLAIFSCLAYSAAQKSETCGQQDTFNANVQWSSPLTIPLKAITSDVTCSYTINAEPGQVVEMQFGPFKVGVGKPTCDKPFVMTNSTGDDGSYVTETVCGNLQTFTLYSLGQQVNLILEGTNQVEKDAVTVIYRSVDDPYCGAKSFQATRDPSTEFRSPLKDLMDDYTCRYTFQARDGEVVKLEFLHFNVGTAKTPCEKPLVSIESLASNGTTVTETICGTERRVIYSAGQTVNVKLEGTAAVKANAITLIYQSVSPPTTEVPVVDAICGPTELTAYSNPSTSWNAPAADMKSDTICTYTIKSGDGTPVHLTFNNISIGTEAQPCAIPYVRVDEQSGTQTTELGTVCGSKSDVSFKSSGSVMLVTINGTSAVKKESFTATYKSGAQNWKVTITRIMFSTILMHGLIQAI